MPGVSRWGRGALFVAWMMGTHAPPAFAVGCVRASCPTMADDQTPYLGAGAWRLSQGYRFFESQRHFIGDVEQPQRAAAGTQVINDVSFFDEEVTYGLAERFDLDLDMPLQLATRSTPVIGASGGVLDRDLSQANGLSDMQLALRGWLLPPGDEPPANLELGLGLKLPTGNDAVLGPRRQQTAPGGPLVTTFVPVDESIQPGDGGWDGLLQLAGFWQFSPVVGAYLDGSYLLSPQDTNDVSSGVANAGEEVDSIADQYQLRLGVASAIADVPGLGVSLGGRLDGVPVHDLVGGSDGFRRPGFALSLEPGLSYSWHASSVALNLAIPLYRNRLPSVPELQDGISNGDAAFADGLITLRFSQTFGAEGARH